MVFHLSCFQTLNEPFFFMFCAKVVNELTRMSNVTPGIFRKTLTDVQVKGILLNLTLYETFFKKEYSSYGFWIQPTPVLQFSYLFLLYMQVIQFQQGGWS
jgi:hypothetical protein